MRSIRMLGLVLYSFVMLLSTNVHARAMKQTPTEQQMLAYLKQNARPQPSDSYSPFHYINLEADLFLIRSIKFNAEGRYFDQVSLEPSEMVLLADTLQTLPMFHVTMSNEVMFWFAPVAGTARSEIIRGLYLVKKAVEAHSSSLIIDSRHPSPGGVSVGNF